MKKTLMLGGLAALTFAAAGGVALAQQAPAAPPERHARADADGDGRISQAEFVQQRVQRLTASDANRDGTVTVEERQAAMQAHRAERSAARFDRMDADNNGTISRTEFDTAHAARGDGARGEGERRGGHHRGRQAARHEGRDMAHQGGRHGGARGADRGPVVIANVQAKATEAFARMDTNSDGYISAEEGQAARQQMRERMTERRAARQANRQASPAPAASE